MERYKFPRTPHLPFSPGWSGDDERLSDISLFEGMEIVVTEKMDGESTTIYSDGYIHARSMDGTSHPSRNWVKAHMGARSCDIPAGWRVCGESVYGIHSIEYTELPTFFFVFSVVNEKNQVLAWDEVVEFAQLLDLSCVPVIYRGPWEEANLEDLGVDKMKSHYGPQIEGYVCRNAASFPMGLYGKNVAKYVRKGRIQTDEHWLKNWRAAKLKGNV